MVSTRGAKFKFSEGEKVLCYEPDPTKAKVLYDSKVLEVCVSKDNKGRKLLEYLIHFSGWSNTWDRCVTEEFILKDNEENRSLQKRLSEAAAIHLKTKKKKRRLSDILKESSSKRKCSDAEQDDWKGSGESNASQSTASSDGEESEVEEEQTETSLVLSIPDVLKEKLEEDYTAIKKNKKLVKLPYEPNVVAILEGYVKNYAANLLCATPEKPNANKISSPADRNISLCKEVMDGIRIYFDFTLPVILLFNEEQEQYKYFMKSYCPSWRRTDNIESCKMTSPSPMTNRLPTVDHVVMPFEGKAVAESHTIDSAQHRLKIDIKDHSHASLSPKLELHASSSKSPVSKTPIKREPNEESSEKECPRRVLRSSIKHHETITPKVVAAPETNAFSDDLLPGGSTTTPLSSRERRPSKNTRTSTGCRQTTLFTSRPSSVSGEGSASPPPLHGISSSPPHGSADACSSQRVQLPLSFIPSHISSKSSSSTRSGPSTPITGAANQTQQDVMNALNDTLSWYMIPSYVYQQIPPPPSLIYGPQHLLRLFVKLPEMITRTNIPGKKLATLLLHLELFLKYLEHGHGEYFPSSSYVDAGSEESTGGMSVSTNDGIIQR